MSTSITRFPPTGHVKTPPISLAACTSNLLFVSGTPGYHEDGSIDTDDFGAQFDRAARNLRRILETGGSSIASILKVNVLLTRATDVEEMNTRYATAFGPAPYPARTTSVVVALPDPRMLIEIECVALVEEGVA